MFNVRNTDVTAVENSYYITLTKQEFYKRYQALTKLEEDLDEKGENLSDSDAIELSALVSLVIKDRKEILLGEQKIKIGVDKYYCIQFQKNKIEKIKETIQKCLDISSIDEMLKFFESEAWYREAILSRVTTVYLDTLEALRTSHKINKDMLKVIKKLESLQVDVISADIYPALSKVFFQVLELYKVQKRLNEDYNKQILNILSLYQQVFADRKNLISNINHEEKRALNEITNLGESFIVNCTYIENQIKETFDKAINELAKLATNSSYKVFITSIPSTGVKSGKYLVVSKDTLIETADPTHYNHVSQYIEKSLKLKENSSKIEADCSTSAVWKIERVDGKILSRTSYTLASLSNSLQLIESSWKVKLSILSQKSDYFNLFSNNAGSDDEESFFERFLNKIIFLQATCIQNKKHNKEIDLYYETEEELLYRPISSVGKGEKVFIQNTLTKKYLICPEQEITEEERKSHRRHKDSALCFTDSLEMDDRTIWQLTEGYYAGSIMINNVISGRYLIHSRQKNSKSTEIVGNPQIHIKQETIRNKSFLARTQLYEGLWKFIKIEDTIREIEKWRNQNSKLPTG